MSNKKSNTVGFKGTLEVDFLTGNGTVTDKDGNVFNFFKELTEFNGKNVTISIKEENELETIDEQ